MSWSAVNKPPVFNEARYPQASSLNLQIRAVHKLYVTARREMHVNMTYSPTARGNVEAARNLLVEFQRLLGVAAADDDVLPVMHELNRMVTHFVYYADVPK
jgi:hypothetical protein